MGYWTPQLLLLLSVQWLPWWLLRACGQNTLPPISPLGVLRGVGALAPWWGCVLLVAYRGLCLPPFELGEGSAGPCWVPSRWGIGACMHHMCVWLDPCGVVSLGVKGGRCWGCDIRLALASPALQSWGGRAYCACPLPMNCSRWWHVVMVGAALLESVIPSMLSIRVAD